jgi:hypothetical protein
MIRLAATRPQDLRALLPMPPDQAFAMLQAEAGRLSPAHAALFAQPVPEDGGIGWGAPGSRMARYADIDAASRAALTAEAGRILSDLRREAERQAAQGGGPLVGLWPAIAEIPSFDLVFAVDGRPVLAGWGHVGAAALDVTEVEPLPVDEVASVEALADGCGDCEGEAALALARAEGEPLALAEGDAACDAEGQSEPAALGEGEGVGSAQPAAAPAQEKVGGETEMLKELGEVPLPTAAARAAPVEEKLPAPSADTPSYAACAPAARVSVTLYSAEAARRRAAPLPPPPASRRRAPDAEQLTALCTMAAPDAALVTTPTTLCVTLDEHAALPLVPGGSDAVTTVLSSA